jgi:micrococcal nuclease
MSRRGAASFGRKNPILRLLIVVVLSLAAYWGKSHWPVAGQPATHSRVAAGAEESTLVERVVDGDTLVISGGDRIRLIGVDTPETKHPTKPAQPFGKEASEFTRRMVEGKRVQIQFDPGETKDKYGRTLAYVYIDGQFLNEMLLREGLARALLNYPFSAEAKARFRAAEAEARAAHRGIWSLPTGKTDVGLQSTKRKAS